MPSIFVSDLVEGTSLAIPAPGVPDAFGVRWWYALDGWDSPDVRQEMLTRPGVAGGIPGDWQYTPRALVLRGVAYCGSESGLWNAIDRAASAFDATEYEIQMQVTTAVRQSFLMVRRAGKADMVARTDRVMDFSIPLVAPDPRKYAMTESRFGPFVVVTDDDGIASVAGSVRRVPIVRATITGGTPAIGTLRFRNHADSVSVILYDRAIANGETVTFDFASQTVSSSTAGDVTGFIRSDSVWPDLIRGDNDLEFWTETVGGRFTANVYWRNAWL